MLFKVHFQKYRSITITGQVHGRGGGEGVVKLSSENVFKDLNIQYCGKQLCYSLHRDLSTLQMTEAFPAILWCRYVRQEYFVTYVLNYV